MSASTAEVVICGAGIAGIAAAYELAVHRGMKDVVLVEQDAPLSLTSDKSTECYRNWWPGPGDAMVRLMNRSIDRLEWLARETDNRFLLNRRGYLYASARDSAVAEFRRAADEAAGLGAGAVRMHEVSLAHYQPAPAAGFEDQPTGADIIVGAELVASQFPYLARDTVTALHARRCGWLSAQQLGMYLLEAAREQGVRLVRGRMQSVDASGGRIGGVRVDADGGVEIIATPRLVIAAGPHVNAVAALLDIELPIYSERHVKMTFEDARARIRLFSPRVACP